MNRQSFDTMNGIQDKCLGSFGGDMPNEKIIQPDE